MGKKKRRVTDGKDKRAKAEKTGIAEIVSC